MISSNILGIFSYKDFKKYLELSQIMLDEYMHGMIQNWFFFLKWFLFILLNFKFYDLGTRILSYPESESILTKPSR